jgi:hypothetical protein
MSEHDKHQHRHGHGDKEHCGEGPEHSHHRHGGECGHGGHGEHHRHGGECRHGEHGGHRRHGGECGCGCEGAPFRRRFITREEQIAWLEEYLKELQAEAKGVEERIAELKAGE